MLLLNRAENTENKKETKKNTRSNSPWNSLTDQGATDTLQCNFQLDMNERFLTCSSIETVCSREAVAYPPSEIFRTQLDGVLSNFL